MTTPPMADVVPGLERLRQVLTSPKLPTVTPIEVEREVERRCSEFELRYGAAALLQLKGGREGCRNGHLWIVVGEGYACILCRKIRS